jgi:molecular chaperone DnaK
MGKSIGIDLGTTNSVVAFKDATVRVIATGPNNEDLCRSCVAVDKSGSFVVGNSTYKNWRKYAPNIVVSVKRLMGAAISDPQVQKMKENKDMYPYGIAKMSGGTEDSVVIIMNGKEYTPEQISAEILRQLKNDASVKLGDEITHAVITVPAYFNEKQKTATRKAAELAGLKVQRLLAEPTAAAISYGADKMAADEDKIFLVYDFGGGTFDLSILVASGGNFIESGTGGDRWLGGDDIDRLISEYVITEVGKTNNVDIHEIIDGLSERKKYAFQGEFKDAVESAKKALSQTESATIAIYDQLEDEDGNPIDIEVSLTRRKFEAMIRPLVQRTLDLIDELLEKTAYPIDTIDNILLVGGSSCIPLVRKMLCDKYGKDKILSSEKPMLAIAEGAAILSHSMGTESECPYCGKLVPIGSTECPHCHHSFESIQQVPVDEDGIQVSITTKHKCFIQIADDADNIEYKEIIDENTPLPFEVSHKFYTTVENQKIVGVELYSDAENNQKEKLSTGFFTISDNLPVHSELQFTFSLTEDEIMLVKVRVPATGKTTNIILSRGALDSHCLESIAPTFDRVMNDQNISDSKKADFVEKLQKVIDTISTANNSPENNKWQEVEDAIKSASQVATTREEGDSVQMIIAEIQLENFGRFIKEEDKVAMRRELDRAQKATSPIEKNDAVKKLDDLTEKYSLFTHGFLLNIAGHDSADPVRANKALVAFNQFMAALNEGNVQRARDILSANESLIGSISLPTTGSSTHITG